MIISEFYKGQGLGNQLAVYAAVRAIALNKNYDFAFKSPEKFKGLDFFDLDFGQAVIGGKGPEGGPPLLLPEGIEHYYAERQILHPKNGSDIRLYDPYVSSVPDNTKIDGLLQGEEYLARRKEEIREWLRVKEEYECYDYADPETCVINFRGGEYVRHSDFFLRPKYWEDAVGHMKKINPAFRFIIITDDVAAAKKMFPEYEAYHFSIAKDYVVIKNAKYLILSNSTFAWFPAWLNADLQFCIAPQYWGRHNISDGYWSIGPNLTKGWHYLDRNGNLHTYEECQKNFTAYITAHPEYYPEQTPPDFVFRRPKLSTLFANAFLKKWKGGLNRIKHFLRKK